MNELARRLWLALLGEERPSNMLILLTVLVVALHGWLLIWLMQPSEKITPAQPLVMEVSMIAVPAPKPAAAPPAPPPPPEKKPPPPKKTPPKAVVRKPPPIVQKSPDFAPVEAVSEPPPVAHPPAPSVGTASTPSSSTPAPSNAEQFTEARISANYGEKITPTFPAIARSRGWSGKVLLKVQISAQGLCESVTVEQSSGHEILDDSATEAVKEHRFIPAKRGETPVASTVFVPIIFKMNSND